MAMTRGRKRQALERRLNHLRHRLDTQDRGSSSAYDGAEAQALAWAMERDADLDDLERMASRPDRAMDVWWTTTGDDWAVPNDLPAKFLKAALDEVRRGRP